MVVLAVVICTAARTHADNWPRSRGPDGSSTSTETGVPVEWSAEKNVAWKIRIPVYGWSSPIVWDEKVFVTTAVAAKQEKPADSSRWRNVSAPKLDTVYQWRQGLLPR